MAQKITHFSVGDLWQPQFSFTSGGNPVDPTTITVLQQDPAGVETTVASSASVAGLTTISTPVAKMSVGVFKLLPGINLTSSGYWFVKGIGQGNAQATIQEQATVDPDEFVSDAGVSTRALVSLAETKDWLQQQNLTVSEDLELVRVINDVSDRIHYEANREFKPIAAGSSSRFFPVTDYCGSIKVGDMNVLSTTSPLTIYANDQVTSIKTFATTDLISYPLVRQAWEPIRKIVIKPTSYSYLVPGQWISVTGTWGFPSVPGNIRQAALDAISSIMDRDVEHYRQDLDQNPATGEGTVVTLGGGPVLMALPATALSVVLDYRDPLLG